MFPFNDKTYKLLQFYSERVIPGFVFFLASVIGGLAVFGIEIGGYSIAVIGAFVIAVIEGLAYFIGHLIGRSTEASQRNRIAELEKELSIKPGGTD